MSGALRPLSSPSPKHKSVTEQPWSLSALTRCQLRMVTPDCGKGRGRSVRKSTRICDEKRRTVSLEDRWLGARAVRSGIVLAFSNMASATGRAKSSVWLFRPRHGVHAALGSPEDRCEWHTRTAQIGCLVVNFPPDFPSFSLSLSADVDGRCLRRGQRLCGSWGRRPDRDRAATFARALDKQGVLDGISRYSSPSRKILRHTSPDAAMTEGAGRNRWSADPLGRNGAAAVRRRGGPTPGHHRVGDGSARSPARGQADSSRRCDP